MKLTSRTTACAVLSAAFVFGAAAPCQSQATPLAYGHGAFVAQNQESHLFTFAAVQLPGGSVVGHCLVIEPATRGFVHMEVTSFVFAGDTLGMAGPILVAVNAPPQFVVGGTAFFAVNDNSPGAPDAFAGLGTVPPYLGSLTAAQIVALLGPPPPVAFAPLLAGDIRIWP